MEVERAKTSAGRFDQAADSLCQRLKSVLREVPASAKQTALEIRLRVGVPVALTCPGQIWFVGQKGELHNLPQRGFVVEKKDIADSIVTMCAHSVHTHQNEMRSGFVSLKGGHRAGICGTAVHSGGEISAVRDVTSINLRIAREIPGAARVIVERVFDGALRGALIAGPPSSGKTTVLRDLARQLAGGEIGRFCRVAVIDERQELGAVFEGAAQNDLGVCADILSGYPKGAGIQTAVRTLSPEVIVCDEIGETGEVEAIIGGLNCGVKVIASAHAGSPGDLLRRPQIRRLLEHGAFERVVMLGGERPGEIRDILEVGEIVDQTGGNGTCRTMLFNDGPIHGVRLVEKSFRD